MTLRVSATIDIKKKNILVILVGYSKKKKSIDNPKKEWQDGRDNNAFMPLMYALLKWKTC